MKPFDFRQQALIKNVEVIKTQEEIEDILFKNQLFKNELISSIFFSVEYTCGAIKLNIYYHPEEKRRSLKNCLIIGIVLKKGEPINLITDVRNLNLTLDSILKTLQAFALLEQLEIIKTKEGAFDYELKQI